jgi:hypothetical protein
MPLPTVSPSETSFNPQTVCVWETGLFIARWYDPSIPATKDEVIALAAASGVSDWKVDGLANFTKLARGMKARYGLTGTVVEGGATSAQPAALAAAAAGPCAIGLAGNQLNLTPHHQDRSVGHAIAVFYPPGSETTGIQLDPLAREGYSGDRFSPVEMKVFTTAAIILPGAPREDLTPGYKAVGQGIGQFMFVGLHHLISPLNPKVHFPRPDGSTFDVVAVLDLKTPDGTPVDIEGNSPPLNNRDQVYLVDAPSFGIAAFALRQDGVFIPAAFVESRPGDDG